MYISKFSFLIFLFLVCLLAPAFAIAQDKEKMENVTITIDSTGNQSVVVVKDSTIVKDTSVVKHTRKKVKSKVNTEINPVEDLLIDDATDNDMYTPYEKWRIELFDDWGKHKNKTSQIKDADSNNVETIKVIKKKDILDNEKEN